jgi:hypothetical protein
MIIATFKRTHAHTRARAHTHAILPEHGLLSIKNGSYLHTYKEVQILHNCSLRAVHIQCMGFGQKISLQRLRGRAGGRARARTRAHTHNFIFSSNKKTSLSTLLSSHQFFTIPATTEVFIIWWKDFLFQIDNSRRLVSSAIVSRLFPYRDNL